MHLATKTRGHKPHNLQSLVASGLAGIMETRGQHGSLSIVWLLLNRIASAYCFLPPASCLLRSALLACSLMAQCSPRVRGTKTTPVIFSEVTWPFFFVIRHNVWMLPGGPTGRYQTTAFL